MTNADGSGLTHLDGSGRARMVDVGAKRETERAATARAVIAMRPDTLARIRGGTADKGDVLAVAQVAAVMAVKRTSDLIPLCHPLPVSAVDVRFAPDGDDRLAIEVSVRTFARTGVEMEALTGAAVGALAVYDMCKAIDRAMAVTFVGLLEKSGGRSGEYRRAEQEESGDG